MCGILGATRNNWDFKAAVAVLRHRGPDSKGIVHNPDLSLGFTRLAIIDLSREADQPMSNAEKTVWIVFNGEIYGYKGLREQLMSKGCRFRTKSDTEVILHAYLEWGNDFVRHIDGMFAIAIHDLRSRELKIWRDRVGIKPFYYFYDEKDFAFASELKGITALCRDVNFQHDTTALYDYLTYHYIPDPKTLYKNVFKLLPAHQLIFDLKERKISQLKPYWQLETNVMDKPPTLTEAGEHLRTLIGESVKDQLVADVPVGCFLSGGMDSSVVAAEASLITPGIETFSIGFADKKYTETHFAKEVSQKFNIQHHVETLSGLQTSELSKRLKIWYDEPFADTSAFPNFLVSEFARKRVAVVLTGDGGDEVFGGYPRFQWFKLFERLPRLKSQRLRNALSALRSKISSGKLSYKILYACELLFSDELSAYAALTEEMPEIEKQKYAKRWSIPKDYDRYWYFRKYYRKDLPVLTRMQYLDFHTYLPSDVLTKVDRVSMAVSLEARVPLLSRKIIEYVFSLPENIRYCHGALKGLLKEAYKDILPQIILRRPKQGFSVPRQYFDQNYELLHGKILKEIFEIE